MDIGVSRKCDHVFNFRAGSGEGDVVRDEENVELDIGMLEPPWTIFKYEVLVARRLADEDLLVTPALASSHRCNVDY